MRALLVPALAWLFSAAPPAQADESFGAPGKTAVVQVVLHAAPGVLFNKRGPSKLQLSGPFAVPEVLSVARGTPLKSDPETYDTAVPPLRFEIAVPADVKPGDYSLKVSGDLYLCDESQHACFRTHRATALTLHVGTEGVDTPLVVELASALKPVAGG